MVGGSNVAVGGLLVSVSAQRRAVSPVAQGEIRWLAQVDAVGGWMSTRCPGKSWLRRRGGAVGDVRCLVPVLCVKRDVASVGERLDLRPQLPRWLDLHYSSTADSNGHDFSRQVLYLMFCCRCSASNGLLSRGPL